MHGTFKTAIYNGPDGRRSIVSRSIKYPPQPEAFGSLLLDYAMMANNLESDSEKRAIGAAIKSICGKEPEVATHDGILELSRSMLLEHYVRDRINGRSIGNFIREHFPSLARDPNDMESYRRDLEHYNELFAEKDRALKDAMPLFFASFKDGLAEYLKINGVLRKVDFGALEKMVHGKRVVLIDPLTLDWEERFDRIGLFEYESLTIQILDTSFIRPLSIATVFHELAHAVSGALWSQKVYVTENGRVENVGYMKTVKLGATFFKPERFSWLDEAITENIALDVIFSTAGRSEDFERLVQGLLLNNHLPFSTIEGENSFHDISKSLHRHANGVLYITSENLAHKLTVGVYSEERAILNALCKGGRYEIPLRLFVDSYFDDYSPAASQGIGEARSASFMILQSVVDGAYYNKFFTEFDSYISLKGTAEGLRLIDEWASASDERRKVMRAELGLTAHRWKAQLKSMRRE